MKKYSILFICLFLSNIGTLQSQESSSGKPNYIKSGFYLKFGVVLPSGSFADGQYTLRNNPAQNGLPPLAYLPAKIGAAMDMGYLIYLGPSFVNHFLRAGIDASFLNISFNSTSPAESTKKYEHYYYFGGQKFGPVLTVNPVDRLMIDLSYKLCANFSYYFGEWHDLSTSQFSKYGANLLQQEVSMSLRYRFMLVSFQYDFGDMTYDNFDNTRTKQTISTSSMRILIGVKL